VVLGMTREIGNTGWRPTGKWMLGRYGILETIRGW